MKPCYTHIHHHHRCFCDYDVADEHGVIHTPVHHIYSGDDDVDVCGVCGDESRDVLKNYIFCTIPFHFANLHDEEQ